MRHAAVVCGLSTGFFRSSVVRFSKVSRVLSQHFGTMVCGVAPVGQEALLCAP